MTTILFVWTLVAAAPNTKHADWRPFGEFASIEACVKAAKVLVVKPDQFRCVSKF